MRFLLIFSFLGFFMVQAQTLSACEAARSQAVLVSETGWIFNDFDLADSFAFEDYPAILPYIKALGQAFTENAMIPIVALLPSRGMVYGEGLSDYDVRKARDAYQAFRNTLNQNGFLAPDLLYAFQTARRQNQQVFFKLDHHWLPQGSELTAQEVSNTLKQLSLYNSFEKSEFSTVEKGSQDYKGSRLLQLEELCGATNSPNESFTRYVTQALEAEASGGLFGDIERPKLLLLGTSNSEETMNFQGFLQQFSGLKVLRANMIGGAVLTPLQNFLASDDYQLEAYRPPFVIWEFNVNTTLIRNEEILDFSEPLSYRQLIPALYGQCEAQSMLSAQGQGRLSLSNSVNLDIAGSNYYLVIDSDRSVPKFEVLVTYQNGLKERLELVQAERLATTKRYFLEFSDFYQGSIDTVDIRSLEGAANLKAHICNTGKTVARKYDLKFQDLMTVNNLSGVALTGLDQLELSPSGRYRWALGEQTKFSFILPEAMDLQFDLSAQSPIENQSIELLFNGQRQDRLDTLLSRQSKTYLLKAQAGLNTLELNYADWNHNISSFAPNEPRQLSVNFTVLRLGPLASFPDLAEPELSEPVKMAAQISDTAFSWDLARASVPPQGVTLEGFGGVEGDAGRWVYGPESKIKLSSPVASSATMNLSFFNPIEGQGLELFLNGQSLASFAALAANSVSNKSLLMTLRPGDNELSFRAKDWNGNKTVLSASDTRPMAVFVRDLRLSSGNLPVNTETIATQVAPAQVAIASESPTMAEPPLIEQPAEVTIAPVEVSIAPAEVSSQPLIVEAVVTAAEPVPTLAPAPAAPADTLPTVNLSEGNLIATNLPQTIALEGMSATEDSTYRWALGPDTQIDFKSDKAQALEVVMDFFNPIDGQSITVTFNGSTIQDLSQLHQGTQMSLKFFVNAIPGVNRLSIRYSDWNGNKTTFAPSDDRPMALLFRQLELRERQ